MSKIKLSSIVAMAENRAIGKDNALLWHISEDLKRFKALTMGKPMIMGRKSFDSLPGILPGRAHIVISRNGPNEDTPSAPALHYTQSIEAGIALGRAMAEQDGTDEAFIIGGGEIYKQTLPLIDRLYLTVVHRDYEGDTFFPDFDWDEWTVIEEEPHEAEGDKPAFTFFVLERK